jgi:hypothetical protein
MKSKINSCDEGYTIRSVALAEVPYSLTSEKLFNSRGKAREGAISVPTR